MLKLTWKMENIQITFLKLKSNSQKVNKAWRQTSDELPSLRFLTQPCGDAVPAPFRAMKAQKKPDEDVNVHLGLGGGRAGNIFRSFGSWRCFLELNFLWNHKQKILIQLFNRGGLSLHEDWESCSCWIWSRFSETLFAAVVSGEREVAEPLLLHQDSV